MKILVTGASGFIGSNLVPQLVATEHNVITFGRSKSLPAHLQGLNINHIGGDITNACDLKSAMVGVDVVYHLAGLVSYRKEDLLLQKLVNVQGTDNVMQAAMNASVKRVIYTGSIAGMGIPAAGTIGDETITYNLAGKGLNYCDTKHEAEQITMNYALQGLPVVILNPGIIFGEGDTHPHHHAIFLAMSKGWLIGWPSGGVTFCDINDVVQAHVSALTEGSLGQRYVLGSANLTYREAAMLLSQLFNSRAPQFEIPGFCLNALGALAEDVLPWLGIKLALTRQVVWLAQQKIFFSWAKAQRELNLRPTPFQETIRRTASYYVNRSQ